MIPLALRIVALLVNVGVAKRPPLKVEEGVICERRRCSRWRTSAWASRGLTLAVAFVLACALTFALIALRRPTSTTGALVLELRVVPAVLTVMLVLAAGLREVELALVLA